MARTFFAHQQTFATGVHVADNEHEFQDSAGDSSTAAGAGNPTDMTHAVTTDPGTTIGTPWPTGDYVRTLDISAADTNNEFGLLTLNSVAGHHARVNNAVSSELETNEQTESAHTLTGLKTCSTGSVSWSSGTDDDLYESLTTVNRTSGHGSTSITERWSSDAKVVGPWEAPGAPDENAPFFGANF